MLFNSYEFLFIFAPVAILVYYGLSNHRAKLWWLLLCSYFFYGYWNYKFLPLLIFSTTIDFYLGLWMSKIEAERKRRQLMIVSLVINLGLLGYFKYAMFLSDNALWAARALGADVPPSLYLDIILPVGISFYTFQSLSYTLDIYFRQTAPHRDYVAFATYVALFPQLIAGPIVRHSELVYQLENPSRGRWNLEEFNRGLIFFVLGLSKKILIADRLAAVVDPSLGIVTQLSTVEAWIVAFGYTLQLYFDFSGYSDMAVGLGHMLGFQFPANFKSPYKSRSITEFWQRWHISLSGWLRDYLYIPLGGNRYGAFKTYRNLLLTMILGGFWHGANWTYIIWGFFHGALLAFERLTGLAKPRRFWGLHMIWTFLLVTFGWIVFRAQDVSHLSSWLERLVSAPFSISLYNFEPKVRDKFFPVFVVGLILVWAFPNTNEIRWDHWRKHPRYRVLLAMALALCFLLCVSFMGTPSPFLYFQF
jgi:alginate O-acetyltransferase complex protein AlgI